MLIYDPRTNIKAESNNPALILAHFIEQEAINSFMELDSDFWRTAINNTDYCDCSVFPY